MFSKKKKEKKDTLSVELELIHSYGAALNMMKRNCCYFLNNSSPTIMYPAGRYVASIGVANSENSKKMDFLYLSENIKKIDAMAISKDKTKIAVAQRIKHQKGPNVMVYNLISNDLRSIQNPMAHYVNDKTKADRFAALCFSRDKEARYLACVTDSVDTQLMFWNLRKPKHAVIQPLDCIVSQIKVNPEDTNTISISGPSCFNIFKVYESRMTDQINDTVMQLDKKQNFTDHEWIGHNHVALGTDSGQIYIIAKKDQYVLIHTIQDAFYDQEVSVTCLMACSRGLVAGSSIGNFSLWVRDEEAALEDEAMKLQLETHWKAASRGCQVLCMDMDEHETKMVIAFSKNLIAVVDCGSIYKGLVPRLLSSEQIDNSELKLKMASVKFDFLYRGFHFGQIDHIDVCIQRPLIATCSNEDSFVKIWNYVDYSCDLNFMSKLELLDSDVQKPLLSLAFHPSGYYLALGLVNCLKFMFIMDDRPLEFQKIPEIKSATILRFSNGGHYLAAAYPKQKSKNYLITIMNSYTLEFVRTFQGHTGLCTDLYWAADDKMCYSCGEDGNLCTWNAALSSEEHNPFQDTNFVSVIADHEGTVMLAGYEKMDDRMEPMIREEGENLPSRTHPLSNDKITNLCLLKSVMGHEAILVGTAEGEIKIYPRKIEEGSYATLKMHIGPIKRLAVNPTGCYVFSVGQDGLVNVYSIYNLINGQQVSRKADDAEGGVVVNLRANCMQEGLADVVLVSKKDIQLQKDKLEKLKSEIENLNSKLTSKAIEVQNQLKDEQLHNQQQLAKQLTEWTDRCEKLEQAKLEADSDKHNMLKANDENHIKAVEDLEALYEKKLTYENDKYQKLERELNEERTTNKDKFRQMEINNEKAIDRLRSEFDSSYKNALRIYEETRKESKNLELEYKERLAQQEEEHELEIRELNSKHKEQVDKLARRISHLTSEKDRIKNNYQSMESKIDSYEKSKQEQEVEIGRMVEMQREQQAIIDKLKKELEDFRDSFARKEKQVYEAKSKINDLQKAKHVLSFRTTEMRKSLEPKEAQIEKLKEELYKMEGEFENMIKSKREQSEQLERRSGELRNIKTTLEREMMKTKQKEATLNRMKMEIFNCVNMKEKNDKVKHIKAIYQDYVMEEGIKQNKHDPKGIEEMMRHIQYLEKSIHQINIATDKLVKNREMQIMKRTKDNIQLIADLNELRTQKKNLDNQNKKLMTDKGQLIKDKQKFEVMLEKANRELDKRSGIASSKVSKSKKFRVNSGQRNHSSMKRPSFQSNPMASIQNAEQIENMVRNKPEQTRQYIITQNNVINELRGRVQRAENSSGGGGAFGGPF